MEHLYHDHPWLFWFIIILCIWEVIWKLIAMWKAAGLKKVGWFILLGILNTAGILPIIYILYENKKGDRLGNDAGIS